MTLLYLILAFALFSALVWTWVNIVGGRGRSLNYQLSLEPPTKVPGGGHWPRVAVIAPGRDEAPHLPQVLPRLCSQDYETGRYQVVLVDDASTDDTPAITAEMAKRFDHLVVVRNDDEPPAGWMGKCWAVQCGVAALDQSNEPPPDWMCFTDADILWDPRLLRSAMAYALEHDADLLGVAPTLRFGSAMEAIVQLQLVLALGIMMPFEKAMDPNTPWALTGGAFILVRRRFYDAIGGHEAVKGEMVEDLKLGMALKAAGACHRVAIAGELQECRMYDGVADMWEGLTKNAYAGLNHRWWNAAGAIILIAIFNVFPPVYALLAGAWLIAAPGWMPALALLAAITAILFQARALNTGRKLMHLPVGYAWTMSLGAAAYSLIIVASAWRFYRGGNLWKGRRYAAGGSTSP
ncbi:MAG: glycosyltransferase family A protein [Algisphaera sp.]